MLHQGTMKLCYAILDYTYVWHSAEGAYDDEIDYNLVSVHDEPQAPGNDQVCRQAVVFIDPSGSCQFLSAQESTTYSDVFRACTCKCVTRTESGEYVVSNFDL